MEFQLNSRERWLSGGDWGIILGEGGRMLMPRWAFYLVVHAEAVSDVEADARASQAAARLPRCCVALVAESRANKRASAAPGLR